MASGVDLLSAKLADSMGIPFWAIRPWAGHAPRKADVLLYKGALENAEFTYAVSPFENYPGPWVYQKRNEWMVDRAHTLLAVWDGSPGGTNNCLEYAIKRADMKVCILNPNDLSLEWL